MQRNRVACHEQKLDREFGLGIGEIDFILNSTESTRFMIKAGSSSNN